MEAVLGLVERMMAARGEEASGRIEPGDATEARLRRILARCHEAWPDLSLPDEAYVEHLGARLPREDPPDAAITSIQHEDLFLACACLAGDPRAVEAFDRLYLSQLPTILSSLDGAPGFVEDATQVILERLLVGQQGGQPKLVEYGGRGSLLGWIRVAAVRSALNLLESEKRHQPADTPLDQEMLRTEEDPELAYIKARYRTGFEAAFRAAVHGLSPRDRNLLRFYVVDRLNFDQIGAIHGVHRATAARWIAEARCRILEEAHRQIRDRLNVSGTELESLQRLVQSQLEVSIVSFLKAG